MNSMNSSPAQEYTKRPYYGPSLVLKKKSEITQEYLKSLFTYDPITGIFKKKSWQGSKGRWSKEVTYGVNGISKYIQIPVGKKMYFAHRLAFVYMDGVYPQLQVDHIDGNGRNNSWVNLRLVAHKENAQHNVNGNKNNTTGFRGVYRYKGKWKAMITVDDKQKHLGVFDAKEDAHSAYLAAKKVLHFN